MEDNGYESGDGEANEAHAVFPYFDQYAFGFAMPSSAPQAIGSHTDSLTLSSSTTENQYQNDPLLEQDSQFLEIPVHPPSGNMNQDLMGINFSYSLINPSDQNFLSAHSPRPLPNLQSLPYLQPQNRLEDPGGAVAIGHLDSFIHCLENGNYPPSVLPRMAERLDRAYSTFQNLEKSHLPVAPGPRSLGESSKPGVSYLCLKCPQGKRKTIKSLGSFKRHVTTEHYYQYEYHCPRECPWFARRKDKVHDHLRSVHRERGSAGLKHMGRFEKQLPPPKHCPQCLRPVESWKDFFHCFASHCRVEEDGSPLSRRGDDDSGSGGGGNPNGQNDWNPGPSGINPGSYFPQGGSGNASFSANDTSYSGGGGGAYNNFHYASPSLQNVILSLNGEAPPSDQICPSAAKLKSDPPKGGQACPLSSPRTSVSALLQKSAAPPPSKAVSGTKNPLLGPLSAVHNASAGCEPSEPSKPPYTPNGLKHSKHRANLSDRKRKEKRPPKKSDAPRRQCLTCGHLFDGCARCQSVKLEGDWCHACLGRCGQRQVQPISYACHDPDSYLNFICNGVSERPSLTFAISVFTRLSFQPPWSVKDVCRALMSNTKLSTECKGAEQIPSWADVTSASTGINVLDFVANPNRFDQASRHDVPSIIHPMVTKSMALLLQSQPRKVDRPDRRVVPMPFELSRCFSPSAHFHQRKVGLYDYCRDLLSGDDSCNLSVMTIPLGFSEDVLPLRSLQFPSRYNASDTSRFASRQQARQPIPKGPFDLNDHDHSIHLRLRSKDLKNELQVHLNLSTEVSDADADTASTRKRPTRGPRLRTRLRIIVKLFQLQTTVANNRFVGEGCLQYEDEMPLNIVPCSAAYMIKNYFSSCSFPMVLEMLIIHVFQMRNMALKPLAPRPIHHPHEYSHALLILVLPQVMYWMNFHAESVSAGLGPISTARRPYVDPRQSKSTTSPCFDLLSADESRFMTSCRPLRHELFFLACYFLSTVH